MENRLTWGDLFHDVMEERLSRVTEIERCMNLTYPIIVRLHHHMKVYLYKDYFTSHFPEDIISYRVSYAIIPQIDNDDHFLEELKKTLTLIT
jgi:hypothetical protein